MEEINSEEVQPAPSKEPSVNDPITQLPSFSIASIKLSPTQSPLIPSPSQVTPTVKSNNPSSPARSHKSATGNEDKKLQSPQNIEADSFDINDRFTNLTETVKRLSQDVEGPHSPSIGSNVDKIATMSQILTNEAKALRQSIKSLAEDIVKTKKELCRCNPVVCQEDVNFPYHLFLVEIIINKIHMKCECFDIDYNNLIISATFLGKQPIVLYDSTYGKIDNFAKLNVGKSTLFAMTYDKICSIKEFEIIIELTKQPPCSNCVTKIGETRMDYTNEFIELREELCKKWVQEQPQDNIMCTTSTPLSKNMYYLSCGDINHQDSIGIIEVTVRMSFLGKEISTSFTASPKTQGTSLLCQEDNGMTMYSSHKVEMDETGKVLLDEDVLNKKSTPCYSQSSPTRGLHSPGSQLSTIASSKRSYGPVQYSYNSYSNTYNNNDEQMPKYDEIATTINSNELKIKVPKSTKVERIGKYNKIQELCNCEPTPYNTGDQIQFAMPPDFCDPHKPYTSNLKYTYNGYNKSCDTKNRKIVNVTPSNCPVPVAMEKMVHPKKDVFILKIGKKLETKDKKTELEIELVTPKAPNDNQSVNINNIEQQCSTDNIKKTKSKDRIKKKVGKKGKKEKGKPKKKEKKK